MARLTQRVSVMWTSVKCPSCCATVQPERLAAADASPDPPDGGRGGQRWSFLWTPPRGDFCPECDFPLSKYFGRLKWIRTLMIGVAIVILALVIQTIIAVGRFGDQYIGVMRVVVLVGAAVSAVGAVGIVVRGKRRSST